MAFKPNFGSLSMIICHMVHHCCPIIERIRTLCPRTLDRKVVVFSFVDAPDSLLLYRPIATIRFRILQTVVTFFTLRFSVSDCYTHFNCPLIAGFWMWNAFTGYSFSIGGAIIKWVDFIRHDVIRHFHWHYRFESTLHLIGVPFSAWFAETGKFIYFTEAFLTHFWWIITSPDLKMWTRREGVSLTLNTKRSNFIPGLQCTEILFRSNRFRWIDLYLDFYPKCRLHGGPLSRTIDIGKLNSIFEHFPFPK